jgi:hypothetical protein
LAAYHSAFGGRKYGGFSPAWFDSAPQAAALEQLGLSRLRVKQSTGAAMPFVRYADGVETINADEPETFQKIIDVMSKGGRVTRERHGRSVRTSHAKAHGLLKGELQVAADLPDELRQGLFAVSRTYPVIARLAHVPGEFLDDRKVSTPRGMALKIIGVDGEVVAGHEGEITQDFVLDTGKIFNASTAKVSWRKSAPRRLRHRCRKG